MKTSYILLIAIYLLSLIQLHAQENYQLKKIDGKEYILYTVQAGDGLLGIARKFQVESSILQKLNPDIVNGLKISQIILIPATKVTKKAALNTSKSASTSTNTLVKVPEKVDFTTHIVEKKQTLFAICRKYDISQNELKKWNPEIENGLKTGMKLRIPTQATSENTKSKKSKKEPKTVLFKHIVKPKETLYAISKLYDVNVEDVIKLNPTALASLIIGAELTIEVKKEIAAHLKKHETKPIENQITTPQEIQKETDLHTSQNLNNQFLTKLIRNVKPNTIPIKIAVLLPLVIENAKADAVNERFQEFYAGLLLAAKEAKNKGVSINFSTFDTQKSEEKVMEILKNPTLKNVDLIIGPAYSNQISLVSEFAKSNKINTIIPFSSKVNDINDNPYLIQFNPSRNIETEYLANLLTQNYKNDHIIFVDLPNVFQNDAGFECSSNLKTILTSKSRKYTVVDLTSPATLESSVVLEMEKSNIFIFNTDKFSSVFPYLNYLNSNALAFNVLLYEQYSWKSISTQSKFKSFSIAPFKPLLNKEDFALFKNAFDTNFKWNINASNPLYNVLGYDLGNYAIALVYEYGQQFGWGKMKLPLASGIQSFLKFERNSPSSGFINTQLYEHER